MIGQIVSRYRILERVGEGETGVVYKAQDLKHQRIVALKFLPLHLPVSATARARLLEDAKAASTLEQPSVCKIFDVKQEKEKCFVVMEFVDGKTLTQTIPVLNTQLAISYGIHICAALHEAHIKGIIHGAIMSDNIMVTSKKRIKVLGFGLAKLKGLMKVTRSSPTLRRVACSPPEGLQGGDIDARSDIYSLGVLLYEMLTGEPPFRGEDEARLVHSILNEKPVPIRQYRPDLTSGLAECIHRAIARDPNDRFESAAEMLAELRQLKRASFSISKAFSRPSGEMQRATPPQRMRYQKMSKGISWGRALLVLGGIILLMILAGIALRTWILR